MDEHEAKRTVDEGDKAKEVQQQHSSVNHVDRAEAPGHPENEKDEDSRPPDTKSMGADTNNDEQVDPDKSARDLDVADEEYKNEAQATVHDVETGKQEEKTNEDHGGEELVEGQEDDVMY